MWHAVYDQPNALYDDLLRYDGTGGERVKPMMVFQRKYNTISSVNGIALVQRGSADILLNPTIDVSDVTCSRDGSAWVALTNAPVVEPDGLLSVTFTAVELQCKRLAVMFSDTAAQKEWEDLIVIVETYGNSEALHPTLDISSNSIDATAQAVWNSSSNAAWNAGSIGEQLVTNLDAAISSRASTIVEDDLQLISSEIDRVYGNGGTQWEYEVYTGTDANKTPVEGCKVWITDTDNVLIAGPQYSNADGKTYWMLEPGTYHVHRQKAGYSASNPDVEVVA